MVLRNGEHIIIAKVDSIIDELGSNSWQVFGKQLSFELDRFE